MERLLLFAIVLLMAGCNDDSETQPTGTVPIAPPTEKIVFVGDSMTDSWWNLREDIVNAGVSGDTSGMMLARYEADVLSFNPTIVSILAGTNDVRYIQSPTVDNIARMAELAAQSGACVILGTVPPIEGWVEWTDYEPEEGNQRLASFNEQIKDLALAYEYKVADYYTAMMGPDGEREESYFHDTVHPSTAGINKMWEVVEPLLTECGALTRSN